MKDRQFIGRKADQPHFYIKIKDETKLDVIAFLKKNEHIFGNDSIMKNIVYFTKKSLLLRRPGDEAESIAKELRENLNAEQEEETIKYMLFGFFKVIPQHYVHLVALFFGYHSFQQITCTEIHKNGETIARLQRNGKYIKSKIDVPKAAMPVSFVHWIAKSISFSSTLFSTSEMVQGGFHKLNILLSYMDCFWELSIDFVI